MLSKASTENLMRPVEANNPDNLSRSMNKIIRQDALRETQEDLRVVSHQKRGDGAVFGARRPMRSRTEPTM